MIMKNNKVLLTGGLVVAMIAAILIYGTIPTDVDEQRFEMNLHDSETNNFCIGENTCSEFTNKPHENYNIHINCMTVFNESIVDSDNFYIQESRKICNRVFTEWV